MCVDTYNNISFFSEFLSNNTYNNISEKIKTLIRSLQTDKQMVDSYLFQFCSQ